jgi:hypothetical protein
MATKYTKVNESYDAKVHGGYLYVRTTGINHLGMLVQGDRVGTIYRMPYTRSLADAISGPAGHFVMNAIDACMMGGAGEIIKEGRLIR